MMAYSPDVVVGAWAGNTAPDGRGQPTAAFGTNVGSAISARFINGLPQQYNHWYSRPAGLVQGRGGELFLPGTQATGCSAAGQGAQGENADNGTNNNRRPTSRRKPNGG
jgi:hypothetical protein